MTPPSVVNVVVVIAGGQQTPYRFFSRLLRTSAQKRRDQKILSNPQTNQVSLPPFPTGAGISNSRSRYSQDRRLSNTIDNNNSITRLLGGHGRRSSSSTTTTSRPIPTVPPQPHIPHPVPIHAIPQLVHAPDADAPSAGDDDAIDGVAPERPRLVAHRLSQRTRHARLRHLLEFRHVAQGRRPAVEPLRQPVFLVEGARETGPRRGQGREAVRGRESALFRYEG